MVSFPKRKLGEMGTYLSLERYSASAVRAMIRQPVLVALGRPKYLARGPSLPIESTLP